ncbi:hypothetical protein ABKN59_011152 [Abortiporus biennis]
MICSRRIGPARKSQSPWRYRGCSIWYLPECLPVSYLASYCIFPDTKRYCFVLIILVNARYHRKPSSIQITRQLSEVYSSHSIEGYKGSTTLGVVNVYIKHPAARRSFAGAISDIPSLARPTWLQERGLAQSGVFPN